MTITENLNFITSLLPSGVKLVAVSKTKSIEEIKEAYCAGQRLFGENKVQELIWKWQELPNDIEWHYIGHLQTNKVKQLIPYVSVIHSVDSLKLLSSINKEAEKAGKIISVLLEFHIATEESKFGLTLSEAEAMLTAAENMEMNNVRISGVMGMATFTDDEKMIRSEFEYLKSLFNIIKENREGY